MKKSVFYIAFTFFALLVINQLTAQSNSSNPYDKIGQIHNKVVKDFLQNYGDKDLSDEEVLNISSQLCVKHGLPKPKLDKQQIEILKKIIDGSSTFGDIVSNIKSPNIRKYLSQLLSLFDQKKDISYNEFYNEVVSIENSILKDESLTKNEKKILLETTSIARYSTYLWNDYFNNHSTSTNSNTASKKWWWKLLRWLAVGGADVAGFLLSDGNVSSSVAASNFIYNITK